MRSRSPFAAAGELPVWMPPSPRPRRAPPARAARACALLLLVALGARAAVAWRARASATRRCDVAGADRAAVELRLGGCGLSELPALIGSFTRLQLLDLSANALRALPELPPTLRVLFLSHNAFDALPPQLGRLPELRMLALRANRLTGALPSGLLPAQLKWLILTDNRIGELPADLGAPAPSRDAPAARCELVKLMLANNALRSLPASLARCSQLELVRLANNQLDELPPWLARLPRLAWLALAANPAVSPARPRAGTRTLELAELGVERGVAPLGSGTSGVVYRGALRDLGAPRADGEHGGPSTPTNARAATRVAVKLFKSERTSDGLTADEARASAAAGAHAGVVRALALVRAPDGGAPANGAADAPLAGGTAPPAGIVLEWLDGFRALGEPPDFATISRDTLTSASPRLRLAQTLRALCDVCGALAHLHSPSVRLAHGDVYAHNVLVHPQSGRAKLGDFGAAYSYGELHGVELASVERIEVRAFGILIAELAARIRADEGADARARLAAAQTRLRKLATQASSERPEERPLFSQVCETLEQTSLSALAYGE